MSESIYRCPYFYIIQHIESGKYYAGVRYGKNSNPDQLLKSNGYQTSSKFVKKIILEEGLGSFVIRKIKVFETGEQAINYETRFLRKVNASFNDSFINRCNNSISTLNVDQEKRKQTCLNNFCAESPMQSEEIKEKHRKNCLEKYGFENVGQVPEFKEKSKKTCLEKYGYESSNSSPIVKQKQKETLTNLSNRPIVLEIRKYGDKFKLKLGPNWYYKSQEFLDDLLAELKLTYDLENPSQILESEGKMRKIIRDLLNQPTISELTKYRDEFKLNLGRNWYWKSQEILDGILAELKLTYGEISENI